MRVEIEGIGPVEFEDGTPEEVIQRTVRELLGQKTAAPNPARVAVGVGETALQGLTGLGASAAGGAAGLIDWARGSDTPGDTVRKVQQAWTYQPRTPMGRSISELAALPMETYSKGVRWVGDKVRGDESGGTRDALGTTVDVLGEAAPALWGGASMLKATRGAPVQPLTQQQRTLVAAQKEGYTVPPALMDQRSVIEGMAGKARTAQVHSAGADKITRDIAVKELGLPKGTELTPEVLQKYRDVQYQSGYAPIKHQKIPIVADDLYRKDILDLSASADRVRVDFQKAKLAGADDIAQLADGLDVAQMTTTGALEYVKDLRSQASKNLAWRAQPSASAEALGHAQKAAANAIEDLVARNLEQAGRGALVERFKEARVNIAKSHSIEDALNPATGSVSARDLAKAKNADAFTGSLAVARDFGRAFPRATQKPEIYGGTPPVSPLDASMAQGMAVAGAALKGDASGLLAGGIPVLRPMMAPLTKSGWVQRGLVKPQRSPPKFGMTPWGMPFVIPDEDQ